MHHKLIINARRVNNYSFKKDFPEIYQRHQALMQAKNTILKDSVLLRQTKQLKNRFMFTFQEALLLKAEEIINSEANPISD